MKSLKALRILGWLLAALGAVGVAVGLLAPSSLIIEFGVRAMTAITAASCITLGVGAVSLAGGSIPLLVQRMKTNNDHRLIENKRKEDSRYISEYAKDSLNPEKARARLEQLRRNNPDLSGLVDKCLMQLDRIDAYQARHRNLLDANEAIYLEDTVEVIDESERRMCQNIRNIINCCILVEDAGSSVDELDQSIIQKSLSDNEEELSAVSTLLKYSVAYINNYNRNGVKDRSELDAWLKIMKSSMEGTNE